MKLILASASPRRAEILRNAGFAFEVRPAHVDETMLANEGAEDYVRRIAEKKAQAVADSLSGTDQYLIVIGADTAVLVDGEILGKPADDPDARRMLRQLSGRTHQVLTGIALIRTPVGKRSVEVETTRVTFSALTHDDIEECIATGEPFDKAGAYGIQGVAGRFIPRIEGCYFNVMGLPLSRLWEMLREMGWRENQSSAEVK